MISALAIQTSEPVIGSSTTPPGSAKHSFLDPIHDFVRDDVLRPAAPFELVPGKNPNGWSFVLEPYVWAMGLSGNVGVQGKPPTHLNLSSRRILENLNWGIFARGEIRKGRWGLLADGLYASLSASGDPDPQFYDHVSMDVQQSLVSAALAYRVIDDRRGFLDVYAGVRYNYLGVQMSASHNQGRIDEIGESVADEFTERAVGKISEAVQGVAPELLATASQQLTDRITERLPERDLRRIILAKSPGLRHWVRGDGLGGPQVGSSLRQAAVEYVRALAAAKLAALRGIPDGRLQTAVTAAKKKLAAAVSDRIEEATPTYQAGDQWWFDPIVGLRGQLNLTRWLFLAAQGDVGGFGAGSQIAWNAQATVGVNFTRNLFGEIGYRYYYVDYTNGGFLYNMNSYGLYSGFGVKF